MTNDLPVQTLLVSVLTTAALALLCVVTASWFWLWLAPPSEAPAAVASPTALSLEAAYGVFGGGRGDSLGNVQAGTIVNNNVPAATGLAIRLLGIVAAEGDGEDYAVVELEPGTIIAIREGEEFAPGIHLTEVGTDHLVLERGGVRETLTWPQP